MEYEIVWNGSMKKPLLPPRTTRSTLTVSVSFQDIANAIKAERS